MHSGSRLTPGINPDTRIPNPNFPIPNPYIPNPKSPNTYSGSCFDYPNLFQEIRACNLYTRISRASRNNTAQSIKKAQTSSPSDQVEQGEGNPRLTGTQRPISQLPTPVSRPSPAATRGVAQPQIDSPPLATIGCRHKFSLRRHLPSLSSSTLDRTSPQVRPASSSSSSRRTVKLQVCRID
jgi:hypothetical protein